MRYPYSLRLTEFARAQYKMASEVVVAPPAAVREENKGLEQKFKVNREKVRQINFTLCVTSHDHVDMSIPFARVLQRRAPSQVRRRILITQFFVMP